MMMLDGLVFSKEQMAIVGLDLLRRVISCKRRLFAVLDGSVASKIDLREFFPNAVIPRCHVHRERNIRAKLLKRHWGELARLFKRLREVQGVEAALEVVREVCRKLGTN
jgi:putative transposase